MSAKGINRGKYAYNNLQHDDATWCHKFNAKWHTVTDAWYIYERDVPNVAGNVANPVPTEAGANGAFCRAGFRSDFLVDERGRRTGIPGKYSENTF